MKIHEAVTPVVDDGGRRGRDREGEGDGDRDVLRWDPGRKQDRDEQEPPAEAQIRIDEGDREDQDRLEQQESKVHTARKPRPY